MTPRPLVWPCLALMAAVCGCALLHREEGRPGPADTPGSVFLSGEGSWCDWAALDWEFDRGILARAYLFAAYQPENPFADYLRAVAFAADDDSLGLDGFFALPAGDRARRVRSAADHRDQALKLRRSLESLWNRMRDNPGAYHAGNFSLPEFIGEGVTESLHHLVAATGLNPSDPGAWYDLSVMADAAGDHQLLDRALRAGLAALDVLDARAGSPISLTEPGWAGLRRRLLLDTAWLARDEGRYDQCLDQVAAVTAMMGGDALRTPEQAREAILLRGLALAGAGRTDEARVAANQLTPGRLPRRQRGAIQDSEAYRALDKRTLEAAESDFERRWIRAVIHARLESDEQALAQLSDADFRTEFPAHLNHRFWNDMGQIQEQFGKMARARLCYTLAVINRPLFIQLPMVGARGSALVLGQPGAGQIYFLGYRHFYLCGSLFSYAANRLVAMELTEDGPLRSEYGRQALHGLDACLRRGINPLSSLVLRGRVQYRLGNREQAEADLSEAAGRLRAAGREDPDALVLLGILHFDRGDYRGCLPWLRRYCELRPDEGIGWRLLGLGLIHAGQLDEALPIMDHAVALDPASAVGFHNRGLIHLQQGRREDALRDLEQAQRLWPQNEDIRRLLAVVRETSGSKVKLSHDRIRLSISTADSLEMARSPSVSPLNLVSGLQATEGLDPARWLGMGPEAAGYLAVEMEARFEADPTEANRAAYALCLLQADRPLEVRRLLSPVWNRGIGREELVILLQADRALGLPARAKHLAGTLLADHSPLPDAAFWELVAVICLENGEESAGRLALDHAIQLDPANTALHALRAGLPAGP